MADPAMALRSKYDLSNRYANFGHLLRSVRICGFRGIEDLTINFDYPVTAVSGLNGAGKSTIGQLAICAYKKPSTGVGYNRFYVANFLPVSVADPSPFQSDARVVYTYETTVSQSPQEVTVSRVTSEWSGYKRQPERFCYYVGVTFYLPKVERRDLSIYRAKNLELRAQRPIPDDTKRNVGEILNQRYDQLRFQSVGHGTRESELGVAQRYGNTYSENNMGFGEGRVLYMVDNMEEAPEQSLFILEEPETSLHQDAQHRFARYLLDVCNRRHHQVILSTHSDAILEALPSAARQLLFRDRDGVVVFPNISSTRARSILSGGHQKALTICVEDEFAKIVLSEIVRECDPSLLRDLKIEALGSIDAVRTGVDLLSRLQQNAIGIRDGDAPSVPNNKLFSLPGSQPPEVEVYSNAAVQSMFSTHFNFDLFEFMDMNDRVDHHELTSLLADALCAPDDYVACTAARAYAEGLDDEIKLSFIDDVRKAV